jgi:hypothetical protein
MEVQHLGTIPSFSSRVNTDWSIRTTLVSTGLSLLPGVLSSCIILQRPPRSPRISPDLYGSLPHPRMSKLSIKSWYAYVEVVHPRTWIQAGFPLFGALVRSVFRVTQESSPCHSVSNEVQPCVPTVVDMTTCADNGPFFARGLVILSVDQNQFELKC